MAEIAGSSWNSTQHIMKLGQHKEAAGVSAWPQALEVCNVVAMA